MEIYNLSLQGYKYINQLTKLPQFRKEYSLVDQLKRASISITANIAEGYGRSSKKNFSHFRSIFLGSCNETLALLDAVNIMYPRIELNEIQEHYDLLGKKLWSFRKSLNSQYSTKNS